MITTYEPRFAALSPADAAYLAQAIQRRHPDQFTAEQGGPYESGEELMHHCDACGLDHADVIMSLSTDGTAQGVAVIETLLGQPIQRPTQGQTGIDPATNQPRTAAPRQPRTPRRTTDPRVVTSVAPNPKKPGSKSHARYELYTTGATVTSLLSQGLTVADIKWDTERGFVTLGDPA